MTSKLEKKFFEAFGIETYYIGTLLTSAGEITIQTNSLKNPFLVNVNGPFYPEITDRILLELICIANRYSTTVSATIDELKEETLQTLIETQEILTDEECIFTMAYWARKEKEKEKEETYTQVRAVFGLESEARI